jgi:hypothetical protein
VWTLQIIGYAFQSEYVARTHDIEGATVQAEIDFIEKMFDGARSMEQYDNGLASLARILQECRALFAPNSRGVNVTEGFVMQIRSTLSVFAGTTAEDGSKWLPIYLSWWTSVGLDVSSILRERPVQYR